jgi:hypothetical protein
MNADKYDDATACYTCKRHALIGFKHACTRPFEKPCRHCPWPNCNCTHDDGCDKGWLDTEPLSKACYDTVRRCPTCAAAGKDAALVIAAGR